MTPAQSDTTRQARKPLLPGLFLFNCTHSSSAPRRRRRPHARPREGGSPPHRAAEFLRSWPVYGLPAEARPEGGCVLVTTISLGIAEQRWQVVGRAIGAAVPDGMPPELAALAEAIEAAAGPWLTPSAATIDALQTEGYFRGKQDGPSVLDSMISVGADAGLIRRLIALGARLDAPENPRAADAGRGAAGAIRVAAP